MNNLALMKNCTGVVGDRNVQGTIIHVHLRKHDPIDLIHNFIYTYQLNDPYT